MPQCSVCGKPIAEDAAANIVRVEDKTFHQECFAELKELYLKALLERASAESNGQAQKHAPLSLGSRVAAALLGMTILGLLGLIIGNTLPLGVIPLFIGVALGAFIGLRNGFKGIVWKIGKHLFSWVVSALAIAVATAVLTWIISSIWGK